MPIVSLCDTRGSAALLDFHLAAWPSKKSVFKYFWQKAKKSGISYVCVLITLVWFGQVIKFVCHIGTLCGARPRQNTRKRQVFGVRLKHVERGVKTWILIPLYMLSYVINQHFANNNTLYRRKKNPNVIIEWGFI